MNATVAPAGVHHLALQVSDLPRMERFYTQLLGLPVLRRWPRADGPGERSIWLDLGGGAFLALELVPAATGPDLDGQPGWFLVALRIDRADRAVWRARLEAAGHPVYRSSSFTLYVRDPEGNRVGLSHFPEPADADG